MIKALLLMLLRFYRAAISPWIGNVCRFEPSCSRYSMACIESHGALVGSWLTVKRLCKCHPFHPGGFDPPPPLAAHQLSAPLTESPNPVSRPSVDSDSSSTGSL
jgi:putative membrane protein insertion efficiency factor